MLNMIILAMGLPLNRNWNKSVMLLFLFRYYNFKIKCPLLR